jgi:hypothetical protein
MGHHDRVYFLARCHRCSSSNLTFGNLIAHLPVSACSPVVELHGTLALISKPTALFLFNQNHVHLDIHVRRKVLVFGCCVFVVRVLLLMLLTAIDGESNKVPSCSLSFHEPRQTDQIPDMFRNVHGGFLSFVSWHLAVRYR